MVGVGLVCKCWDMVGVGLVCKIGVGLDWEWELGNMGDVGKVCNGGDEMLICSITEEGICKDELGG